MSTVRSPCPLPERERGLITEAVGHEREALGSLLACAAERRDAGLWSQTPWR
jgi:hypothetical protein